MRKCMRCNEEMIESLEYKVDGSSYGIKLSMLGIFGRRIKKPKVAFCPICGTLESYIEEPQKSEKLIRKSNNEK